MTSYGLQGTGTGNTSKMNQQDWHKEKIYRNRIAALMETEEHILSSYGKIKLWEDGPNYQKVVTYVNNSQCHQNVRLQVVDIHRVWRRGDKADFFENGDPKSAPKRMFLWHGTKRVNIPQILDTGFRLPSSSGQMFGAGIYFADRITKSTNYSDSDVTFLLLCEVAIGKVYSCAQAHNDWTTPPRGFDSVKANGMYVPDWTSNAFYYGAQIPFGKTAKCTKYPTHAVNYNEFIVYDPKKIIIRFLVEVKVQNISTPITLVVPKNQTNGRKRAIGIGTAGVVSRPPGSMNTAPVIGPRNGTAGPVSGLANGTTGGVSGLRNGTTGAVRGLAYLTTRGVSGLGNGTTGGVSGLGNGTTRGVSEPGNGTTGGGSGLGNGISTVVPKTQPAQPNNIRTNTQPQAAYIPAYSNHVSSTYANNARRTQSNGICCCIIL